MMKTFLSKLILDKLINYASSKKEENSVDNEDPYISAKFDNLITVKRIIDTGSETLSNIYVNGKLECFGLEDEFRKVKVQGETRIPAGTYKVSFRKEGGFHLRYAKRFSFHRGMLHIENVPGFEYILIHIGNTDADTSGCLLLGRKSLINNHGKISLEESTVAYTRFYKKVARLKGDIFITFKDVK